MKYFVIYLKILVFVFLINSNTYSQDLVSSSGGISADENYQLHWSIGEQFTSTHQQNAYILTEGFHQSLLEITNIFQNNDGFVHFSTYPNPVRTALNVDNEGFTKPYIVSVFGNSSNLVFEEEYNAGIQTHQIDFSNLKSGIYHLRIMDKKGDLMQSSKIVKY